MKVGDEDIPELDPPEDLVFAHQAAVEIRRLIHTGTIPYTKDGINRWLTGGLNAQENARRRAKYDAVRLMLGGRKIDEADVAFRDAYLKHLQSPYPRGAVIVAWQLHCDGDRIEGYPPAVAHLLAYAAKT